MEKNNIGKLILTAIDLSSDDVSSRYILKENIDAKYKLLGIRSEILKSLELLDKLIENSNNVTKLDILDTHQLLVYMTSEDALTKCIDDKILYPITQQPMHFFDEVGNFANIVGDEDNATDNVIKRLKRISNVSPIDIEENYADNYSQVSEDSEDGENNIIDDIQELAQPDNYSQDSEDSSIDDDSVFESMIDAYEEYITPIISESETE